jgi:hypothetical protein
MTLLDFLLTLILIFLMVFIIVNLTNRRRSRPKSSVGLYTMALIPYAAREMMLPSVCFVMSYGRIRITSRPILISVS